MPAEDVSRLLNQIWTEFRRAGVSDDLRIIEAIGAFLLERQGVFLTPELPRKPIVGDFDEQSVRGWLSEASQQAGDVAVLFDRYVLLRLPDMRAGGQYITPRHIVRLMTVLAETRGKRVADFACGSAGLLVHSYGETLSGVEISPEWARIARANLRLHSLQGEVHEGNALRVVQESETFERIVMNPPFGAKIKSDFGARSETALSVLVLNHLAENGRAALLTPSGLLFSGSQAEYTLRQRLVDEITLEAVITLPDDAFQPYSALTTHLLLVQKTQPAGDASTWFLHPVYDGYVSGRGRDLTGEPNAPNDLTLIEKAMTAVRTPLESTAQFAITDYRLMDGERLQGVLFCPLNGVSLVSARYLPPKEQVSASLLLETQQEQRRQAWQFFPNVENSIEPVQGAEEFVRDWFKLRPKDPFPPADVFQSQAIRFGAGVPAEQQRVSGILVNWAEPEKPQLMGVAIPRSVLQARDYSLQPDDYMRAPEISAEHIQPHALLRQMRERQQELAQRMDRLSGWLVPEGAKDHPIPSPADVRVPFGALNETQQRIWESIESLTELYDTIQTAQPFTLAAIYNRMKEVGESEVRLALEIFEAMGLIVPITLKNPRNDQPMNFYRLAQESDRWAGSEEEQA